MAARRKHQLLLKACENGDVEQVTQLIQDASIDVHYEEPEKKFMLLHSICEHASVQIFKLIYSKVKNLELKDTSGKTLIYSALKGGSVDLIEFLLSKGASLNVQDNYQQDPLQYAALNGSSDVCQYLLKQQKSFHREKYYTTMLQLSIKARDLSAMETLLNRIPSDGSVESPGLDILLYSCQFGDLQTMKSLLASRFKEMLDMQAVDKSGRNVIVALLQRCLPDADIHTALDNDQLLEMVKLLVKAGVSLCTTDNYGWTALHYAVYYNNIPAVQLLLNLKHPHNIQSTAAYQKIPEMASALHLAILSHNTALVELLCQQGVSCNLLIKQHPTTGKNKTVVPPHGSLHLAISVRNLEIAQILIDHGADLDDLFGLYKQSVLHRIITTPSSRLKGEKIPFVVNMIERGIDVNSQDTDGNTMLHVLFLLFERKPFSKGNFADIHIAQLICGRGDLVADLLNRTRETALMVGVKCWHRFFINDNIHAVFLLHNLVKCTDLDITDVNGDTVLHHAFKGLCSDLKTNKSLTQLHDFVCMLLEHGCDKYRKNNIGQTPLHTFIAYWSNQHYFSLYLKRSQVDCHRNLERQCVLIDDTDIWGVTILHRAVLLHHIPLLEDILAKMHSISYINFTVPCDISSQGLNSDLYPQIGLTALQIAATQYADCWSIIGILLKSGANVHLEFPEPMYHHTKTIFEVIYQCLDRQRLLPSVLKPKCFFALHQLLSTGAKYRYVSPTQMQCRSRFNKTEQMLLHQKCYLPMLLQMATLGYQFNYDYLITADMNNTRLARFMQCPKVSIHDLEHGEEIMRVIDSARHLHSLEVLAARVVRQNLYPNAWFAWKQLQLPQCLLSTHFKGIQS